MSLESIRNTPAGRGGWLLLFGLAVGLAGCGLDEVQIPELSGPSGHAFSLVVTVNPDVLLADAVSTAVVQATVRGPDGRGVGGRTVFFAVTDENGSFVDLGTLYSTVGTFHPPAPQTTEVTGSTGVAQVVYRVPERISVTAIQPVFILARLVGDDATGQSTRSVQIELRPAEVRRYPPDATNTAPTCDFKVDPEIGPVGGAYPVNFTVRFRTTSFDDPPGQIVRYFWDFADGTSADKPDIDHHWSRPGAFSVTHVVTDNNGAVDICGGTITIVN